MNNNTTQELINALYNNDSMKFEQSFNDVMASKISNMLNYKRNEMAKTVFNKPNEEL